MFRVTFLTTTRKWKKMAESCFILRPILDDNTRKQQIFTLRSLHRDINCSKNTNFVRASRKIRKTDFDRIQKTETWIPLSYFCFFRLYMEIFLLFKGIIQRTIPFLSTFLTDLMMSDAAYPDFTEVRGTGHHHPPYYISHHFT